MIFHRNLVITPTVLVCFEQNARGGFPLLSRTAKSGNKYGVKRALSIMLSSVLAITLLQVAPPARASLPAAPAPLACAPIESVVFDGTSLRRIYDFTQVGTCAWNSILLKLK